MIHWSGWEATIPMFVEVSTQLVAQLMHMFRCGYSLRLKTLWLLGVQLLLLSVAFKRCSCGMQGANEYAPTVLSRYSQVSIAPTRKPCGFLSTCNPFFTAYKIPPSEKLLAPRQDSVKQGLHIHDGATALHVMARKNIHTGSFSDRRKYGRIRSTLRRSTDIVSPVNTRDENSNESDDFTPDLSQFHANQGKLRNQFFKEEGVLEKHNISNNNKKHDAIMNGVISTKQQEEELHRLIPKFEDVRTGEDPIFYDIIKENEKGLELNTAFTSEGSEGPPKFTGDISTESKVVPKGFNAPRPLKDSLVFTTLTNSGWGKREIDKWGPARNRLKSFLTPTEMKRRQYWEWLLSVVQDDSSYKTPTVLSDTQRDIYNVKDESYQEIQLHNHTESDVHTANSMKREGTSASFSPVFRDENKQQLNEWKILNKIGAEACRELPTPQRKLEAWREQLNLEAFYRSHFDNRISKKRLTREFLKPYIADEEGTVLVIQDGVINTELSQNLNLDDRVFVGSLDELKDLSSRYFIHQQLHWIPEHTNYYKVNTQPFHRAQIGETSRKYDNDIPVYDYRKFDFGMSKFTALNQAGLKDVGVVIITANTNTTEKPIQVIEVFTSEEGEVGGVNKGLTSPSSPITNPRVVIWVQEKAAANIQQSIVSSTNTQSGLVNSVTRVILENEANLKHSYVQELGSNVWHFENLSIQNGRHANYQFSSIQLGGKSSRINTQVEGAEGCKQFSKSLGLCNKQQEMSMYQMFHHEHPHMLTEQKFKYLIADKGSGVWRGRVRIERQGVGAMADTLCRVILLNQGVKCVTIPTLEIIPKDVDHASHGAAISDLEEEAIFFLRTRGVSEPVARLVLMKAFVSEISNNIADDKLQNRIFKKLLKMIPHIKTQE